MAEDAAGGGLADAGVIELRAEVGQTGFDVPQTFAPRQLRESQNEELFVGGQFADAEVVTVTLDKNNHTIRKVTPAGVVTTLAGVVRGYDDADGPGSAARFNQPSGVAGDSAVNVYVADSNNNTIRKGTLLLRFDSSAGSLTVSNGFFQLRLTGPSGGNVVVEASANLQAWTPVQTNALPPDGLDLWVPVGTNQRQFFRARLAP